MRIEEDKDIFMLIHALYLEAFQIVRQIHMNWNKTTQQVGSSE